MKWVGFLLYSASNIVALVPVPGRISNLHLNYINYLNQYSYLFVFGSVKPVQLHPFYGAQAVLVLFTGVVAAMTREEGYTRDDSGRIKSSANGEDSKRKHWAATPSMETHNVTFDLLTGVCVLVQQWVREVKAAKGEQKEDRGHVFLRCFHPF